MKIDGVNYKLETGASKVPVHQFGGDMARLFHFTNGKSGSDKETYESNLYLLTADLVSSIIDYPWTKDDVTISFADYYASQNYQAIDLDGNNKIDLIMVYPTNVAKVTSASSSTIKLDYMTCFGHEDWDKTFNVTDTIKTVYNDFGDKSLNADDVTAYDGLAKSDYVIYTNHSNTAKDVDALAKADSLSGKITTVDGSKVTIDGTVYNVDLYYNGGYSITNFFKYNVPSVKSVLNNAVVMNGFIFKADENGSANVEDYAVVTASGYDHDYKEFTASLLLSNGDKVNKVEIDSDYYFRNDGNEYYNQKHTNSRSNNPGYPYVWVNNGWYPQVHTGDLCTYEKNSDGTYDLTYVRDVYRKSGVSGFVEKATGSTDNAGYITGKSGNLNDTTTTDKILDDSVIFVAYANNSKFKVISGASMKSIKYDKFNYSIFKSSTSSTSNGNVNFAYVSYNGDDVTTTSNVYGYVTKVKDSGNVKNVDLFTKDGAQPTINTENNACKDIANRKGYLVSYEVNDAGELSDYSYNDNDTHIYKVWVTDSGSDRLTFRFVWEDGLTVYMSTQTFILYYDKKAPIITYDGYDIEGDLYGDDVNTGDIKEEGYAFIALDDEFDYNYYDKGDNPVIQFLASDQHDWTAPTLRSLY